MAWLNGISTKTLSTLCLMLAVLLAGCDMMDYHPYDVRISGETGLTKKHIALIEKQCAGKDTIRFAQISDTQRWYDETEDMIKSINKIENLDFVIHTGDQADFGLPKEYEWMRSLFSRLKVPYVCVIGNHDCIGSGESSYKVMYGPDNFSFNASFLHFVMLNTNAYEYDYSDDIPNFAYIKNDLETLPDHSCISSTTMWRTISTIAPCNILVFCFASVDMNTNRKNTDPLVTVGQYIMNVGRQIIRPISFIP